MHKPQKNRLLGTNGCKVVGLSEDYVKSAIPINYWDHFGDFEISVKGEGAGHGLGTQTCNTENGDLPVSISIGASDEAYFVSAENVAGNQGGSQSGHIDAESSICTTKRPISVKSLISDGKDESIATGTKPTDEIEGNFNYLKGQCSSLFIMVWVCFMCVYIFITLSDNNSAFLREENHVFCLDEQTVIIS